MAIKFRCPHCEQFLGISPSKAGTLTDCPTCGRSLRVPELDGTVVPLPPPQLDLEDQELRAALGALASFAEQHAAAEPLSTKAVPLRAAAAPQPVPVEIIASTDVAVEAIAVPLPHVEDSPEVAVSYEEALGQLNALATHSSASAPPPALSPVSSHWTLRNVALACSFSALCGLLAGAWLFRSGSGTGKNRLPAPAAAVATESPVAPEPAAAISKTSSLQGHVTYAEAAGGFKPDRGARILLLPLERPGSAKLAGSGFRVGAEEIDRQLLMSSAAVLAGAFELADSQGHFQLTVSRPGRYGLLVASRYQPRGGAVKISQDANAFLSRYFENPQQMIGNTAYEYSELSIDPETHQVRNVQFPIR